MTTTVATEDRKTKPLKLTKLTVEGYRSIPHCEIYLTDLQVLIGHTGIGKEDLLSVLCLMKNVIRGTLQEYVRLTGGPETLFYRSATNRELKISLEFTPSFGENREEYSVFIRGDDYGNVFLEEENTTLSNDRESALVSDRRETNFWNDRLWEWAFSIQEHKPNDYIHLPSREWEEIGYKLHNLQIGRPLLYRQLISILQRCILNFDRFEVALQERSMQVTIYYYKKGDNQRYPLRTLSDDALQLIALMMTLISYAEQPRVIVLYNPETGLHPDAVILITDYVRAIAEESQVIMTTNSPTWLDNFITEEIVTVNKLACTVVTERAASTNLTGWQEDGFSVGELWQKNVISAGQFTRIRTK